MSKSKSKADKEKEKELEPTIEELKKELEAEQKSKDTVEWSNVELERSVRAMEANVIALEAGNPEADDSEMKQKYDNQKQLNVQLQEQKRWLEHELEQVKLKIQNDKTLQIPDPFSLDWDNLSETELKRLVGQLEKTRSDLKSDLREVQWRLDKEGREFHHHDEFAKVYVAEIKNLDRILESLVRSGMIPSGFSVPSTASNSLGSSKHSTGGMPTAPGSPRKGSSFGCLSPPPQPRARSKMSSGEMSPRKRNPSGGGSGGPVGKGSSGSGAPAATGAKTSQRPGAAGENQTSRRPAAGVRNLPKIDRRKAAASDGGKQQQRMSTSRREDASPTRKGGGGGGLGGDEQQRGGGLGTLAEDEEQSRDS